MSSQNLDQLCARYGHKMATKSDENHITKSLGVLQENGVYAFFLYQESKRTKAKDGKNQKMAADKAGNAQSSKADGGQEDKDHATTVSGLAAKMLREQEVSLLPPGEDVLAAVCNLTENLDDLLMAKRLLEQTLIYARYHAKALNVATEGEEKKTR